MPFFQNLSTQIQNYCLDLLKRGTLPKHIAIIGDGNRRYAKIHNIPILNSHVLGYHHFFHFAKKLFSLGVLEVSGHFMSLNNFLRGKKAVDDLFEAIYQFLQNILEEGKLMENGIRVSIWGEYSSMPEKLVKLSKKIILLTKNNDKCLMNLGFPYECRSDLTAAINKILHGVDNHLINIEDIDKNLITNCLYTRGHNNVDITIRASDVYRFSDFLMWQSPATNVYYEDVLFAESDMWMIIWALYRYQKGFLELHKFQSNFITTSSNQNVEKFLNQLKEDYDI